MLTESRRIQLKLFDKILMYVRCANLSMYAEIKGVEMSNFYLRCANTKGAKTKDAKNKGDRILMGMR